jgi:hypothetical protein
MFVYFCGLRLCGGVTMDRHQFVEKLIGMRDELKIKVEKLETQKHKAHKRSAAYWRERLKGKQEGANNVFVINSSVATVYYTSDFTELRESARVTDEDIILLSSDIQGLRKNVSELLSEIKILEDDDVVGEIQALMEKANDDRTG